MSSKAGDLHHQLFLAYKSCHTNLPAQLCHKNANEIWKTAKEKLKNKEKFVEHMNDVKHEFKVKATKKKATMLSSFTQVNQMNFEEITPYKGNHRWFYRDNHFFVACRSRARVVTLRCASDRCPVTWHLRDGQASPIVGEHDHEQTPWVPNRNRMFQNLKRRSAVENIPLNRIYEEEAARYPDGASHLLYESVSPSMKKWRRQTQPAVPATVQEYGFALAEHPRYSNLLFASVSAGDGSNAVILTMTNFSAVLQESSDIVVDGTFATRPSGIGSAQILTLHGVIAGHNYHPILVLMTNRRRTLYEAVLRRLWVAAGNPRPRSIVTDYETGLQSALESVTNGVPVQGCLFHFVQAMLRRAREEGISVRRTAPGYKLVQLYAALALLPPEQVPLGLAEVPAVAQEHYLPFSQEFHDYFQAQWMVRVTPARFSVHGRLHQTSNVAESFHATLRRSLGPAPNVWRFTEVAAEKFAVGASRLEAQRAGRMPRRNRERYYLQRDAQRAERSSRLQRGILTLRQFLWETALNMDVGIDILNEEDVPDVGEEIVVDGDAPAAAFEPEVFVEELVPEIEENNLEVEEIVPRVEEVEPQLEDGIPRVEGLIPQQPLRVPALAAVPQRPQAVQCPICIENMPTLVFIPCGHVICADCRERINDSCPVCRARIQNSIRFYLS